MKFAEGTMPEKLVVLDGFTLNPGDLHWGPFEALASCTIYDRSSPAEVIEHIADHAIVLTNKTVIDRRVLDACPAIRYIGVLATGYNVVDAEQAKERGIIVTNVPGYSTPAVAQLVFAHILNFFQNVAGHSLSVKKGDWSGQPDFCYWISPLSELKGKTIGLVGYGQIAREVATIACAFGMEVICYKPNAPAEHPGGVKFVDKEHLFRHSDIVSLHCPLNAETFHFINEQTLGWMKPNAYLINTGRGDLVDEQALVKALSNHELAGAGLDVTHKEPIEAGHPLLALDHCVITPHLAWASRESRLRLLHLAAGNLQAYLLGNPVHVVNS